MENGRNIIEARIMHEKGRKLAAENRHREAIVAFDSAIDLHMGCAEAYFRRGVCYYKLGQYSRALDDIDAASILGHETARIWCRHQITVSNSDHENTDSEFSS